jgi:uncharacterized repeat protein (TIGR01451 family)
MLKSKRFLFLLTFTLLLIGTLAGTVLAGETSPPPLVDIRKQAEGPDSRTVDFGSDVTFEIAVTNNAGNESFNVKVTDPLVPACEWDGVLDPSSSHVYTCTVENVTESFVNEACLAVWVDGVFREKDCDPSEVIVRKPPTPTNTPPPPTKTPTPVPPTKTPTPVPPTKTPTPVPPTKTPTPPPPDGEGCTPGYWRQDHHFDSWVNYTPGDDFEAVFGVDASFDPDTLLDAVWLRGGGENALARHAVAALLNASSPDVSYAYTQAQIIAMVQNAYATGDFEDTKDMFEEANETFCPLD